FVSLVMNMAAYASGGEAAARNVRVGEPFVMTLSAESDEQARMRAAGAATRDTAESSPRPSRGPVRAGESDASRRWLVTRPDGREDVATVVESTDEDGSRHTRLRYERTDRPGRYTAVHDRVREWFAVTTDEAESDLSACPEFELRQRLGIPFVYVDKAEEI